MQIASSLLRAWVSKAEKDFSTPQGKGRERVTMEGSPAETSAGETSPGRLEHQDFGAGVHQGTDEGPWIQIPIVAGGNNDIDSEVEGHKLTAELPWRKPLHIIAQETASAPPWRLGRPAFQTATVAADVFGGSSQGRPVAPPCDRPLKG